MQVLLRRLDGFGDSWPCCVTQYRRCHLASVKAFVQCEWVIKIVLVLVCTCLEVLSCGLLSPLLVTLLVLLTHPFQGDETQLYAQE